MTLTDLREIIIRNRKKILGVLIVLAIGGGALSYYLSNAPGKSDEEVAEKAWRIEGFSFAGDTRSIKGTVDLSKLPEIASPRTAAIYEVKEGEKMIDSQEAGEIAARFGFTGEVRNRVNLPEGGTMLVYVTDDENLAVFTQPREILYTLKDVTSAVSKAKGKIYDRITAPQKAAEFLESRDLPTSNLVLYDVRYFVYKVEAVEEADSPETANAVEVSFVQGAGGSRILGESTVEPDALVVFDRSGAVVSLDYKYQDSSFTPVGEEELLSYGEAKDELKERGMVILIILKEGEGGEGIEIGDLDAFTPESAGLAYYQPPGSVFLHPIYIFDGEGTVGEAAVSATVILPAARP